MSKRALLIGINYKNTSCQLSGCINDVENVKKYLLKRGYSEGKITVLTDDTPTKPTRANILQEILSLIVSGDRELFLHYSGHGGSIPDISGDEKDGKDECIFPIDSIIDGRKIILDDEWKNLLVHIKEDQKIFALFDCCHSGTGMDLAYTLHQRFGLLNHGLRMVRESKKYQKTKGQVVLLSGCLDPQTSADSYEEHQSQGALTYAFLKTIKRNKKLSYKNLILGVRDLLKRKGYKQIPTLSSGRPLKLETRVDL